MTAYSRANHAPISAPPSLADLGIRLPVQVREGALRAICDADGQPFIVVVPPRSSTPSRALADAIAAALNKQGEADAQAVADHLVRHGSPVVLPCAAE